SLLYQAPLLLVLNLIGQARPSLVETLWLSHVLLLLAQLYFPSPCSGGDPIRSQRRVLLHYLLLVPLLLTKYSRRIHPIYKTQPSLEVFSLLRLAHILALLSLFVLSLLLYLFDAIYYRRYSLTLSFLLLSLLRVALLLI